MYKQRRILSICVTAKGYLNIVKVLLYVILLADTLKRSIRNCMFFSACQLNSVCNSKFMYFFIFEKETQFSLDFTLF